MPANAGIQELL